MSSQDALAQCRKVSRAIPSPIMRAVRQRCGFGCIVCGLPLYEYHHMVPFAQTQRHVADEITLLCRLHHQELHSKLLTGEQIERFNAEPTNIERGVSTPYGLHFEGRRAICEIGSNWFGGHISDHAAGAVAMIPISIDDMDLLWFSIDPDGGLYLTANVLDAANLPLLVVRENTLLYSTDAWDIEFVGRTLTVREALREIFFEISFEPPNRVTVSRARLLCNGVDCRVRESHIYIVNVDAVFAQCGFDNFPVGLQIGRNDRGLLAAMSPKPDTVSRYLLPESEARKREKQTLLRHGVPLDDTG